MEERRGENEPTIARQDDMEDLESWDPMHEDFNSPLNTLALNPERDPECVVTGRPSEDVLRVGKHRVCEHYLKYGSCVDGIYCDRLHINPKSRDKISYLQRAYETNKDRTCLNYMFLSPIELEPNENAMILISVTHMKMPNNFFFIAPYEGMNFASFNLDEIDFYIQRVEHSSTYKTKLQKCHESLASLFDYNYRRDNVNDLIYLGQIVACKLRDGRFCRAEVIDVENVSRDNYLYTLFLLDIGIEVQLSREAIYDIKARSLSAPPMAINGRLAVRTPSGCSEWPSESLRLFREFVSTGGKYLLCKILEPENQDRMFTVDLYDMHKRQSLTELLTSQELAENF